jgi:gliding motility-associated lipoprotein GldD
MNNIYIVLLITLFGCSSNYTPKPKGFSKIDLPSKQVMKSELDCPFSFEHPVYSTILERETKCWFDINFKDLNGKLHMSYKSLDSDANVYIEESRELAYKHSSVAEAINEQAFINDSIGVYGLVYTFEGNTASPIQFYLTDSVDHFLRGALYFNTSLNDSIYPISDFVISDIYHIIESWNWSEN